MFGLITGKIFGLKNCKFLRKNLPLFYFHNFAEDFETEQSCGGKHEGLVLINRLT